jgi:hypothetical protein
MSTQVYKIIGIQGIIPTETIVGEKKNRETILGKNKTRRKP